MASISSPASAMSLGSRARRIAPRAKSLATARRATDAGSNSIFGRGHFALNAGKAAAATAAAALNHRASPQQRQVRGARLVRRSAGVAVPDSGVEPGTPAFDAADRKRRRICIFVEPSPFSHVSGMKNRFLRLIENLTELGDDVVVVTPDRNPPATYHGAQVIGVHGFKLPFYPGDTLLLSFARDPRIEQLFKENPPDLLHCSSPGALIFAACELSEKYRVPLVQSYHTHIPHYIPQYTWVGLVKPMWDLIRLWSSRASVTMVTSNVLESELRGEGVSRLEVWEKGVDDVTFNPRFRNDAMHTRLAGGRSGKVIGCVGRLGAEKNLYALKEILAGCPPGTNLTLIGDGPERPGLERHFQGTNTTFMGMMLGDDLASAYASMDVFVMPSESETLGFVVMEAMASGVPVVAVKAGGLQDILTSPGEVGQLYPIGDYARAAAHVSEMLTNDKEWKRQAVACRKAVEEWSWMASNRKLRYQQYKKAFARFNSRERLREVIDKIGVRRRTAALFKAAMTSQWYLHFAGYLLATGVLFAARSLVVKSGVPAAIIGHAWLADIQGVVTMAGWAGPFILGAAIAAAATVPFVPTQPLFVAAGLLFGTVEGAVVSLAGATAAAATAFAVTRTQGFTNVASAIGTGAGFGAPVRRLVRRQLRKVEGYVTDGSAVGTFIKLVLLRLVPHAPFSITNYLLGLTRVPAPLFLAATAIGMAPWVAFYALVGSSGRALFAAGLASPFALGDHVASILGSLTLPQALTRAELGLAAVVGLLLLLRPAADVVDVVLRSQDEEAKEAAGGSIAV